jgi:hypothetical protein
VSQLSGDYNMLVPMYKQYYDARSGRSVSSYRALTTPDRGVVEPPGATVFVAEDLTLAITDDSSDSIPKTIMRYFGPDPRRPQRWLASSFELAPRRRGLEARPSEDLQRVAVWSEECQVEKAEHGNTALTFVPGEGPEPVVVAGCVLHVFWVGADGTLLAKIWLEGSERVSVYDAPLALIHPDHRISRLDVDLSLVPGTVQAVSSGRVLLLVGRYEQGEPLYAIDLDSAAVQQVAPVSGLLLTDRARKRLAFQVISSSNSLAPGALWAGAFPQPF